MFRSRENVKNVLKSRKKIFKAKSALFKLFWQLKPNGLTDLHEILTKSVKDRFKLNISSIRQKFSLDFVSRSKINLFLGRKKALAPIEIPENLDKQPILFMV